MERDEKGNEVSCVEGERRWRREVGEVGMERGRRVFVGGGWCERGEGRVPYSVYGEEGVLLPFRQLLGIRRWGE